MQCWSIYSCLTPSTITARFNCSPAQWGRVVLWMYIYFICIYYIYYMLYIRYMILIYISPNGNILKFHWRNYAKQNDFGWKFKWFWMKIQMILDENPNDFGWKSKGFWMKIKITYDEKANNFGFKKNPCE